MKIIFLYTVLILSLASCSKNYFQQTALSPSFDLTKQYRLVLADPVLKSVQTGNPDELKNRAYQHLSIEFQKIRNFNLVDKSSYENEVRIRKFGNLDVDLNTAREAAKAAGAQAIAYTELSTEPVKGGLPMMAYIQVLDLQSGNIMYTGKARMDNPVSLEAGLEFAVEKAMEELVRKTK